MWNTGEESSVPEVNLLSYTTHIANADGERRGGEREETRVMKHDLSCVAYVCVCVYVCWRRAQKRGKCAGDVWKWAVGCDRLPPNELCVSNLTCAWELPFHSSDSGEKLRQSARDRTVMIMKHINVLDDICRGCPTVRGAERCGNAAFPSHNNTHSCSLLSGAAVNPIIHLTFHIGWKGKTHRAWNPPANGIKSINVSASW